MTERIPHGTSPEHWAEQQIREAMERGEFDDLPGRGRPQELGDARDPNWWLNRKLRDEDAVPVPPAMALRRDHDSLLADLVALPTRDAVVAEIELINGRIRYANSHGLPGPPSTLMPIDVDRQLARWEAAAQLRPAPAPMEETEPPVAPRRSWWHRLFGGRRDV